MICKLILFMNTKSHTGFRLVLTSVTSVTLNRVMTADARYLCGSWDSCCNVSVSARVGLCFVLAHIWAHCMYVWPWLCIKNSGPSFALSHPLPSESVVPVPAECSQNFCYFVLYILLFCITCFKAARRMSEGLYVLPVSFSCQTIFNLWDEISVSLI